MEVSEAINELTRFAVYLKRKQRPDDEPQVKANSEKLIEAATLAIACMCMIEQLEEKAKDGTSKKAD